MGLFSKLKKKSKAPKDADIAQLDRKTTDLSLNTSNVSAVGTPQTIQNEALKELERHPTTELREAGFHGDTVKDDQEPLWWACEHNKIDIIEDLVTRSPTHPFLNKPNTQFHGKVPLQYVIEQRCMKIAAILLRNDADGPDRDVLLDCAARYGSEPELLDLMLRKWYQTTSPDGIVASHAGLKALMAATYGSRQGINTCVPFLWENGGSTIASFHSEFCTEVKGMLESSNTPTHIREYVRTSGMEVAASASSQLQKFERCLWTAKAADVTKELLSQGFDVNGRDMTRQYDRTPLTMACERKKPAVAMLLIEHGAHLNVDTTQIPYEVPLVAASKHADCALVTILLDNGALTDTADSRGWTSLHWAYSKDRQDIVKLLIEHGARQDLKTPNGETPADSGPQQSKKVQKMTQNSSNIRPASNLKTVQTDKVKANNDGLYVDSAVLRWD